MRARITSFTSSWTGAALGIGIIAVLLFVVAPQLMGVFGLNLMAKYLCWALVAIGIGLAWGRGGMLVLGQGLYFGLGGYAMAMHLKLEAAGPKGIPDFMTLYGDGVLPWWWEPFRDELFTWLVILLLPALVAALVGFAILKRRIKGAYFAILSQALAAGFAIVLIAGVKTIGGFNGLNGFSTFFGYPIYAPANQRMLYQLIAGAVVVALVLTAWLYRSRFGELLIASRDAEERVRFLGHDPANVKLAAYVVAALFAGVAGAFFVPIVGIISPANVNVTASIALLAWAALGGRASLLGPAIGAVVVGFAQSSLSESFPGFWSYFQGALFIVVILLLPGGLASLVDKARVLLGRTGRVRS